MNSRYAWTALLGLGAGMMFLFDPQMGNRRRALLRDKLRRFGKQAGERASAWGEIAGDRAQGFVAETRARLRDEEVDDRTLVERVRAELGRVLSHVRAIDVDARDGCVTLRGDILEHEADAALRAVRTTRGVRAVEDALERHARPGNIPSLQGGQST